MSLLPSRRYDNPRCIETLDPVADFEEIFWLTAYHEVPWEYVQATSIAFSATTECRRSAWRPRAADDPYVHDHRRTYPFGYSLADLGPRTFSPTPQPRRRSPEQTRSAS
jgi:hypothetical protein